jgi:hypothetical protein
VAIPARSGTRGLFIRQHYTEKERFMSDDIDNFTNDLNAKLTSLDDRLQTIKRNIEAKDAKNKAAIQAKLGDVQSKLETKKQEVEASRTKMKAAIEEKQAETKEKIAEWAHNRDVKKLGRRADNAADYAAFAITEAAYAIDEANYAALSALDARLEADEAAG